MKEVGRSMGFQLKEVVSGEKPILAISEGEVLTLGIRNGNCHHTLRQLIALNPPPRVTRKVSSAVL